MISSNCHTTDPLVDYQVESKDHGFGGNQRSMIKSFKTKATLNILAEISEAQKKLH